MKNSRLPAMPAGLLFVSLLTLAACGGGEGGGVAPSPAPVPAPVDTTPPDTTLATGPPALTSSTTATFTFSANEAASFEGRLDGGAYTAVTNSHVLNNLADGSHTFEIRARDTAGNIDATPASATWVVDTTPPDTQITAAPSATNIVNTARFTVSSTEAGGTLEASIDGGAFATVTSPFTAPNLADGPHTIRFRATDAVGNVDASPASASWTFDLTPAQVRLIFPARNFYTDAATVSVRGTAQDPNGVVSLSINGIAAQSTDSFAHWNAVIPVPVATTPVTITSRDGPGNNGSVAAATMMNRGPFINTARGIAYDAQRNRVIVIDQSTGNVVAFDRTTGIGQMLSPGPAPGTTPGSGFEEAVVDAANDRLLILGQSTGQDQIVAVNLANGARSVISPSGGDSSPTRLYASFCLALDGANQRLYVSAGITAAIVRIDLATGARSIVSSSTVGTGAPLANPYGIVFDNVSNPATPRLLVVNASGIVSIDLATGNRTPFSNAALGAGPAFVSPLSMVMDPAGQRVLVSDNAYSVGIIAVSLANGDRTVLDGGTGSYMYFAIGLAFDPVTRTLFSPQTGGYGEFDAVTRDRRVIAHTDVGGTTRISNPVAMFIEQASGTPSSLIYVWPAFGMIHRLNLDTSNRSIISWSDNNIGAGPSLAGAVDMVPDRRPSANGRAALVLVGAPQPKLFSVDLVTGDRTLIATINAGVHSNSPTRMALDVANNRVLFSNHEIYFGDVDELYAVNLANGAVTLLSGSSNTGPTFFMASNMILEPAANPTRALLADYSAPSIIAIDLATGNRSLFDSAGTGSGLTYSRIGPMVVDTARGRLLAHHVDYPSNLFSRPLAGGARELISGANPTGLAVRGTGPPMFWVTAMDVDFAGDVVYAASSNNGSIIAVDLVSGDRVVIAR